MNRTLSSGASTALALIAIFSCSELGPTEPNALDADDLSADPARLVATVEVTLASSSLAPGQTTQASVILRNRYGDTLDRRVQWSSADTRVALVSSSGLVTAIGPGSAAIIATRASRIGSAILTVSDVGTVSTSQVASVSVALGSASLNPGQTTQATATIRDLSNNVLTGLSISWRSSNGALATVSATGLVTAVAAGTAQITATSEGQSGSASLNIQAPPLPPPGSSNEPTGMTLIDERPFNSLAENASPHTPAWDTDATLSIVQDATAPISPSNVIRATYPTGFRSGSAPGHAGVPFTGYKTLYIRFAAKLSLNWQGEDSGFCKYFYVWQNGSLEGFFFASHGIGSAPLEPYAMLQGMTVFPSGNGNWAPNLVPSARIIRGQWQVYEFVLVGNSAGTADGSVDWYLDGVHIGSVRGIQWTPGAALFNIFDFRPVWGGTGPTPVAATQTMDWDHVYISGKN